LKHDLVRCSAYAPLQPSQVELVETHISWVFLLESDVFKVKKPVDLGFSRLQLNGATEGGVRSGSASQRAPRAGCVPRRGPGAPWRRWATERPTAQRTRPGRGVAAGGASSGHDYRRRVVSRYRRRLLELAEADGRWAASWLRAAVKRDRSRMSRGHVPRRAAVCRCTLPRGLEVSVSTCRRPAAPSVRCSPLHWPALE